ncbi:hypothetical protein QA601_15765 [Chitinispirillales bacterium ANBcel5]|uniref:polysaccharide lyase n=1 Tax=Cellulosispirillum alkaliphilum TaxID=3039283 RepID=UPI002A548ADF|nr:hypothetical protein [Chitinispirillales bacterium ANBcel5]
MEFSNEPVSLEPGIGGAASKSSEEVFSLNGFKNGRNPFDDNPSALKNKWGIEWMKRAQGAEAVSVLPPGATGKCLRVSYPRGGVGPLESGVEFPVSFRNIPTIKQTTFDSLYLRYYLCFEKGFDFCLGGKLPGLIGAGQSWKRAGGDLPDGTNGWSMRLMWRRNGNAVVYAYLPPGKYTNRQWGFDIDLNTSFKTARWHCVEQYVKVNDSGCENGQLKVWVDGLKALELQDLVYRTVDNEAGKIGGIFFSTFHGGNTKEWAPATDSFALFSGVVAARRRIGSA